MSHFWDASVLERALRQGGGANTERMVADLLMNGGYRDPAICHLAGLYHFWRALGAKSDPRADDVPVHLKSAIPHLVYALENKQYLAAFGKARERTFCQAVSEEELTKARDLAYAQIEERFAAALAAFGENDPPKKREQIQDLLDEWWLEKIAARLVADIDGVPDTAPPEMRLNVGPAFAKLHGFADSARRFVESTSRQASLEEELLAFFTGGGANRRQEIGYCFSHLARPYLYWRQKQYKKALDALQPYYCGITATSNGDFAGQAAKTRNDARRLSVEIRLERGGDLIRLERTREGLAFWGEALADVDALDGEAQHLLQRRGDLVRHKMREMVLEHIAGLERLEQYEPAVTLLEEFVRIVPREESLIALVDLLCRLANQCAGKDDHVGAADYLKKALLLQPQHPQITRMLMVAGTNAAGLLATTGQPKLSAGRCMDMLALSRQVLSEDPDNATAKQCRENVIQLLTFLLPKLDEEGEQEILRFAVGFVAEATGNAPEGLSAKIEPIRLAHRAQERFGAGDMVEAFDDVAAAVELAPQEEQLRQLYEGLACAAVDRLCDSDRIEAAMHIAERAKKNLPESTEVERRYTRTIFRRMDLNKLLSSNVEDVAAQLAIIDRLVTLDEKDEAIRQRGETYAAILSKDRWNEIQLSKVRSLLSVDLEGPPLAKALLAGLKLTGRDEVVGLHLSVKIEAFLGDIEAAHKIAVGECERFPSFSIGYHDRAWSNSLLGRCGDAEKDFNLLREFDENDAETLRYLAYNSYRAGLYQDALNDLQLLHQMNDPNLEDFAVQSTCLWHLDRGSEVHAIMEKALKLFDASPSETPRGSSPRLISWFRGEISDEELMLAASDDVERLEARFYIGEKLRAGGSRAEGNALLRQCAASLLARHFEWEHSTSMLNRGELDD
jgi:tetratricopeptide (TPR) repeat protein